MTTEAHSNDNHHQTVICSGDTKLGHPQVYLHLNNEGVAVCPYCSKKFIEPKN